MMCMLVLLLDFLPSLLAQQAAPMSILDVPVSYLDKRIGACLGSQAEVDRFREHIFSEN